MSLARVLALAGLLAAAADASAAADVARLEPMRRPKRQRVIAPPKTPEGLPQCTATMAPSGQLPRDAGETIRYHVDIGGLSVGTVDFKIERNGTHQGRAVTEYRSLFKLDSLVSAFVAIAGRAAALVPLEGYVPTIAMNRYEADADTFEEDITVQADGLRLASRRKKNGEEKKEERAFPSPVQDFVSGFYLLRSLPSDADGCTIIYGNQRAYTVWIRPDGQERIKTPVGLELADRYAIRYGSEKSKKVIEGRIWMSRKPGQRLPYQAELEGAQKLVARVHLYEAGVPAP